MKLILIFLMTIVSSLSYSQTEGLLNSLLAPGLLIKGHDNLERTGCLNCHNIGSGLSNSKCLKCHTKIKQLLKRKNSFHGKVQKSSCTTCHSDHKGRNFDSAFIDLKKFDHSKTGYKLQGKHKKVECKLCHITKHKNIKTKDSNLKFLGLSTKCNSCHLKQDKHHFLPKFKKISCKKCHNTKSWNKNIKFNHFKSTNYKLTGKHKAVSCKKCHMPNKKTFTYKWKNLKVKNCKTCHNSPHILKFTKKTSTKSCTACHSTKDWKKINLDKKQFDHNINTNFKINGSHNKLTCRKCHNKKRNQKYIFNRKDKNYCSSCHKSVHVNQFSKATQESSCKKCHNTDNFLIGKKFNHNQTKYPIIGKHKKTKCVLCHVSTKKLFPMHKNKINPMHKFNFVGTDLSTCFSCHKDPHKKQFGSKCINCHSIKRSWKVTNDFHKDFNLTGVHYTLGCKECHTSKQKLAQVGSRCDVCHQKDDVHSGTLQSCQECHKQDYWEITSFKHSLTLFPLRGSHRTQQCSSCHKNGTYTATPSECINCHMQDKQSATFPNHALPGFNNCSECHNQFSFK